MEYKDAIEKVKAYRKSKGQVGMILTHNAKTGCLVKFKLVYKITD